jgi:hypothetical protein
VAELPGRAQEIPLRALACILLIFILSVRAAPTGAQAPDTPATSSDVVRGFFELSLRLAGVHGRTAPLIGAAALLGVSPKWRVGGAGFSQMDRVDLELPPPLETLELHIGYGGLLFEREVRALTAPSDSGRSGTLVARLLIGAGNAEVRDSSTGSRLRSDNFALVEPTISVESPLSAEVSAGASAAYRMVGGVDGLQDIDEKNLRGWSIGVLLRFGPF